MLFFCYLIVLSTITAGMICFIRTMINHIRGSGVQILYCEALSTDSAEYKVRKYLKEYPKADIVAIARPDTEDILRRLNYCNTRVKIKK